MRGLLVTAVFAACAVAHADALDRSEKTMIAAIETKVTELSAMKKLPAGMDAQMLEGMKTELAAAQQQWSQAATAFQEGRVAEAMQYGMAVKASAEGMMGKLGMSAAPAMSN